MKAGGSNIEGGGGVAKRGMPTGLVGALGMWSWPGRLLEPANVEILGGFSFCFASNTAG